MQDRHDNCTSVSRNSTLRLRLHFHVNNIAQFQVLKILLQLVRFTATGGEIQIFGDNQEQLEINCVGFCNEEKMSVAHVHNPVYRDSTNVIITNCCEIFTTHTCPNGMTEENLSTQRFDCAIDSTLIMRHSRFHQNHFLVGVRHLKPLLK